VSVSAALGDGVMGVRWGLAGDEGRVADLLELNGLPRFGAFEERFVVAEAGGEVLGAMTYRTESKRLLLGSFVVDPWAGEERVAVALYRGAVGLARELGAARVLADDAGGGGYPRGAGYRRRFGGWSRDVGEPGGRDLPEGGWRRVFALWRTAAVPFFRASFREDEPDSGDRTRMRAVSDPRE